MGFAVVHMQKIKMGGLRGIQSHNNREKPPRTNPDIDLSRTAQNYNLILCESYQRKVKQVIEIFAEKTKTIRKDAVVCCNFIVTSDEQTMKNMLPEKQKSFFEDSVEWFSNRYGDENIINAIVHMDETTPHLHIGIVPVTSDGRLCAKDLFDKKEMTAIQTDFVREVGVAYNLERGKEGSERTHLSEQRFKLNTAKKEIREMKTKSGAIVTEMRKIVVAEQKAVERVKVLKEQEMGLKEHLESLQGKVTVLEEQIKGVELNIDDMTNIQPQKTITGAIKGVKIEDIENLKRTAVMSVRALDNNRQLLQENDQLQRRVKNLEKQIPSIMDKAREAKEKASLIEKAKIFDNLPDEIKKQIMTKTKKKNRDIREL